MILQILIFAVSIFLIIKGATLSTKFSGRIAKSFNLSNYVVGFLIVAVISITPEAFVAINSAISGVPSMGLGTIFGSNIADLTLVFAIVVLVAGRSLKIESKILKSNLIYPFFFLIPIALGIDGAYNRGEGLCLIIAGVIFYYLAFHQSQEGEEKKSKIKFDKKIKKDILYFVLSLLALLVGSHFIVESGVKIAEYLTISPAVIGLFFIGLGTVIPELLFSISAVKKDQDSLAIGDLLGTVLADATILVGLIAFIKPFEFPIKIIYIAGIFMFAAAFMLYYLMRSGKILSKREGYLLILFWLIFVLMEVTIHF
ncbi:MAG TPA: sodium:calcium antiporter [Candidatus Paceibacterota bacterium]|nr:sodium:calcium antiporter [Candidatus Paceibacterota bacterium]